MTFLSRPFSSLLHALEDGSASQMQENLHECLPYLGNLLVFKVRQFVWALLGACSHLTKLMLLSIPSGVGLKFALTARVSQEKSQDARSKLDTDSAPFADKNLSEGDKTNVRTLSDALNLDEELCVELLLRAHTEGRPVTVEHAAHIYFDERSNLLQALIRMFHIHLGYMSTTEAACKELVEQALQFMTKPSTGGSSASKAMPLKRLCAIVKVRQHRTPNLWFT